MNILDYCMLNNNDKKYDNKLLQKELNIIKNISNDTNLLFLKKKEYESKYIELTNKFRNEFKYLNKQHYDIISEIKSIKYNLHDEVLKKIIITIEKDFLISIKNTFQSIIDKKEETIYTYKILEDIVSKKYELKEEFFA